MYDVDNYDKNVVDNYFSLVILYRIWNIYKANQQKNNRY